MDISAESKQAVNVVDGRRHFGDLLYRVGFGRERVILVSRGRPIAALVPIPDLDRLEGLDQLEGVDGKAA